PGGPKCLLPRGRDVARTGVAPRELRRDLLHPPVPVARLDVEALERIVHPAAAAVRVARPPVDRVLPGLRARLAAAGRRAAQGIAPRTPVLAGEPLEVLRGPGTRAKAETAVRHAVLLCRPDHSNGRRESVRDVARNDTRPIPHRRLRTSGYGWSC